MRQIIVYRYHNLGKVFSDNRFRLKKANDATIKYLRDKAVSQQEKQAARSKHIEGIAFLGLNQMGDLRFACKSQDGERTYIQSIRFYDLHKKRPKGKNEILDALRNSDVGVYCNDPSFLYWGAAYNATQEGYNIAVENRPPTRSIEKKKKFALCKHLIAVLRAVPFYWNNMVGEYMRYYKLQPEELKPGKASVEPGAEGPKTEKTNVVGTKNIKEGETKK